MMQADLVLRVDVTRSEVNTRDHRNIEVRFQELEELSLISRNRELVDARQQRLIHDLNFGPPCVVSCQVLFKLRNFRISRVSLTRN